MSHINAYILKYQDTSFNTATCVEFCSKLCEFFKTEKHFPQRGYSGMVEWTHSPIFPLTKFSQSEGIILKWNSDCRKQWYFIFVWHFLVTNNVFCELCFAMRWNDIPNGQHFFTTSSVNAFINL